MKSNLKKLRKEAGLTLQALASKSGVCMSRLHDLEKDTGNPSLTTAVKIAEALDVNIYSVWMNK